MNIRQITYMAAVVEQGSLSTAAKTLFVTVQAVSKAIAELERELGRDLFVRESRGMHPTPFGRAFYERAVGVIEGFNNLLAFSQGYGKHADISGIFMLHLALNTPPFIGNEIVRENIAQLVSSQFNVETTMDLAVADEGIKGLHDGRFDMMITVGTIKHPDVDCYTVGTVPSGVMMRHTHPLVQLETVRLADLEPYPVALSAWFDRSNETIASIYQKRAATLNYVELGLEDISHHLDEGGVVFTTGIAGMARMDPLVAIKMLASEDAVAIPLCGVCLKSRSDAIAPFINKLVVSHLSFLNDSAGTKQ